MKAIGLAVIVLMSAAPAPAQQSQPVPAKNLHWIVSQSLYRLRQGLSERQLRTLFDNPNTYVIVNAQKRGDVLTDAKHVIFYRDETKMAADLAAGSSSGSRSDLHVPLGSPKRQGAGAVAAAKCFTFGVEYARRTAAMD